MIDLYLALFDVIALAVIIYMTSMHFNLFGTFVRDGTAKAIERNGEFRLFVFSYRGHRWRAENPDPDNFDDWWIEVGTSPNRGPLRDILGGFFWIGIPILDRVHTRNQRWLSGRQVTEGEHRGAMDLVPHNQMLDYLILVDDIYYAIIEGIETLDKFAVKFVIGITMRVGNPRLAWYRIQNWIEAVIEQLREPIRLFGGGKTFDELKQRETASRQLLADPEIDVRIDSIRTEYGVLVSLIQIADVVPEDEEVRKATHLKYVAEQKRDAQIAESEGEAKAIENITTAEAEGIDKKLAARARHDSTGIFSIAEAIEVSRPKTLVLSDRALPSIPVGNTTDPEE